MKATLQLQRISQLGKVVTGKTPSTTNAALFGGEYPFVTPSDLNYNHYYCRSTERSVTESARSVLPHQFIPAKAIMFTCIGATIGKCAIAPVECLTNQQINSVVVYDHTDPIFLYYLLTHNIDQIKGLGTGAATPIVNKSKFEDVELCVPDLPTQRRIAEILSAYDDLIENNQRRMKLLEESARMLYQEWFVRLRFPGHEHTRIIDGVPEGWSRKKLGEIANKIGSGATPRGGEAAYQKEGISLIRSQNVYDDAFEDDGLAKISDEQAKLLESVSVMPRDILLNITGASVARCCMAPERHLPARVNQHVMIIRVDSKFCSPFFTHVSINSDQNKRQLLSLARGAGATREALTKDDLASFEILVPPQSLLTDFHQRALASFELREKLADSVHVLRTARDILLPRLMNGEIEV